MKPVEPKALKLEAVAEHFEAWRRDKKKGERIPDGLWGLMLSTTLDPGNRLVAAELENRWEAALRALHQAEVAAVSYAPKSLAPTLSPELKAAFAAIGQRLPELWDSGHLARAEEGPVALPHR